MYVLMTAGDDVPASEAGPDRAEAAQASEVQEEPGVAASGSRWTPPTFDGDRRTLVPSWLPWMGVALVVVLLLTLGAVILRSQTGLVSIPNVEGLDLETARAQLEKAGMRVEVGDRRFSATVDRGVVIEQSPAPGEEAHAGSLVTLAVSAGSESFRMPDVVGWKLPRAKGSLESRGLEVVVDYTPSKLTSGTVLSTFPSAGVGISTGDSVRLTVAAAEDASGLLLPTDLRSRVFVIDPAPVPVAGVPDAPMEVGRRLRALLEASGAKVVVTRDVTDAGVTPETRAQRAREASGTAVVGLAITQSGAAGITVLTVPAEPSTSSFFIASTSVSRALQDALRPAFPAVKSAPGTGDLVLTTTGVPAARVVLGSTGTPADVRSFSDPAWADSVAQAVYRAVGSLYGSK